MTTLARFVNTVMLMAIGLGWATVSNAQNSKKEKAARQEQEIKNLIDSQKYVFKAQMVYPLGGRSRNLTSDYDLRVTKESVVSYLPYFGRAYSATPGSSSGGIEFTSKEFEYAVTAGKKGEWEILIKPKDTQVARELRLTAYKNGTANLQVNSNDKQSISYSGYIAAIKAKK